MAANRYRLSNRACVDLDEIATYLVTKSPIAARRVVLELKSTFKALARNSELGSQCDDLRIGLRQFVPSRPAHRYIVFYYIRPDGVEISDILHSSRDWQSLFSSGKR